MSNFSTILPSIFQTIAQELEAFLNDADFSTKLSLAFGNVEKELAETLITDIADNLIVVSNNLSQDFNANLTFNLNRTTLKLEFLSEDILGNNGAFSQETNTIYLAESLTNPEVLISTLLEELGHFLDSQLNLTDTVGDEGQLFASLVQNKTLNNQELTQIKAENDSGTLTLSDGTQIAVEYSSTLTVGVGKQYSTIQGAINAAQNGDVIIVSAGTYNEILTISGKNITLASEFYTTGNPNAIAQTIIDGGAGGRLDALDTITITNSIGTKIIGFTIQNGDDGIQLDNSSNVEILNNRILNTVDAIDFKGTSSGTISNNTLENNSDDGIDFNAKTNAIVNNNIIRNNVGDGMEIRLEPYAGTTLNILIQDNLISGNQSDGIQLIDSDDLSNRYLRIERNRIENNRQAGLGLMDNGETNEDYRAASIPEPIDVINNTFVSNNYGITGGDNLVAINNIFVGHTNIAMKGVNGNSIASYNLFWNNGINLQDSNFNPNTTYFANPLLNNNSQLQNGSPAIDIGTALFDWRGANVLNLNSTKYAGNAPDLGFAETNFVVVPQADLELTQVVNNPYPMAGEQVTFTLSLTNKGSAQATGVQVKDLLPTGLTFAPTTTASQGVYDPVTGIWNIGNLNNGQTVNLNLVANVVTTPTTTMQNTAQVIAVDQLDPDSTPNNNLATEDDQASASISPRLFSQSIRVNASTDDAEENSTGSVYVDSSDLELIFDKTNQTVGMRFNGLNIPQGAIITNAYIQFQVDETSSELTNLVIQGEANSNPTTFANIKNNISSRPKTNALVNWSPQAWTQEGQAGLIQRTPNLSAILQEVVNQANWKSGNSFVTLMTGSGRRTAEAFEGEPTGAPLLYFEYTMASSTPKADLELTQTVSNINPLAGENVTFTLTLSNKGSAQATGVKVKDLLPTGLTFVPTTTANQGTYDSVTGIWNVGSLNNGQTVTLNLVANVVNKLTTTINNTAQVIAVDQLDPDSTPNNNLATEDDQTTVGILPLSADLELTQSTSKLNPIIGEEVTLKLSLNNKGSAKATGVQVKELLPQGVTLLSATASQGTYDPTTGIWNVGNLSQTVSNQKIRFAAFGDYGVGDINEQNVANLVKNLNADLIITTGDNIYGVGSTFDSRVGKYYSDYIGNYKGIYGTGSAINRFFPALGNHDYIDAAGGLQAYLDYFTLPGNERYYDFVQGPVHFFAINSSDPEVTDPNLQEPDGNTITSIQAQWLKNKLATSSSPWKIVYMHHAPYASSDKHGSQPALQWDFENWGATAVFSGNDHFYERVMKDVNQDGVLLPYFVTGLGGGGRYAFSNTFVNGSTVRYNDDYGTMLVEADANSITFQFHSVSNQIIDSYTINNSQTSAPATLELLTKVETLGTFTSTAEVIASDQFDPDSTPNNNLATEDDQASLTLSVVNPGADLELTQVSNKSTAIAGDNITFTLTLTNKGLSNTTGVKVQDLLPTGLSFVSATASQGIYDSNTGIWDVGNLNNGQTITLNLIANVINTPTTTLTNTAQVIAVDQFDPDSTPNNNLATEDDQASVSLTSKATLIRTINTSTFLPQSSPDPCGITYNPITKTFFISDGEVDEMTIYKGSNIFQMNLQGQIISTSTTVGKYSNEPTGISFNPYTGNYFISDDDLHLFVEVDANHNIINSLEINRLDDIYPELVNLDEEDVAFGLVGGKTPSLFVSSGMDNKIYTFLPGADGLFNGIGDTFTSFSTLILGNNGKLTGISDPEGVVFNPQNQHLYVVGNSSRNFIGEYSTTGELIQLIDISEANADKLAGITIGASSINPNGISFYLVDRGVDNDEDPSENDGKIYEFAFPGLISANYAPIVNAGADQFSTNLTVSLNGTAQDDGFPNGSLNSLWSVVNQPTGATVTFANANLVNTTATFSTAGDYILQLTANDGQLTANDQVKISVFQAQPSSFNNLYLSLELNGNIGNLYYADEDIIAYNKNTNTWSMYFDGSDVGLGGSGIDLDAFHIMKDGSILLSVNQNMTLSNLGTIDNSDIVRFIPTTLGDNTSGRYEMYLKASTKGLTGNVDAISMTPDGDLVVSIEKASVQVSNISANDEDLLRYSQATGTWSTYFDGSDVGLNDSGDEDVWGASIDPITGKIHFTTYRSFAVEGVNGDGLDIFTFTPISLGDQTTGIYTPLWDGSANGFLNTLDTIDDFVVA